MLNLTDHVFGRLTVVDLDGITINGKYRWLCLCECGGTTITTSDQLLRGKTRSCGCLRVERIRAHGIARGIEPRIGERFHDLVVMAAAGRDDAGKLLVRVRCDCGTWRVMRWGNVRTGNSKTCGCRSAKMRSKPKFMHPFRSRFI